MLQCRNKTGFFALIKCHKQNNNDKSIWLSARNSDITLSDDLKYSRWKINPCEKVTGAYYLESVDDDISSSRYLMINPNSNQIYLDSLSEENISYASWLLRDNEEGYIIESSVQDGLVLLGQINSKNISIGHINDNSDSNSTSTFKKPLETSSWKLFEIEKEWVSIDLPILSHIQDFQVFVPSGIDIGYRIFSKPTLLKEFFNKENNFWHEAAKGDCHYKYVFPIIESAIKNANDKLEKLALLCREDRIDFKEAYKQLLISLSKDKLPITSCTAIGKRFSDLCKTGNNETAWGYIGGHIGVSDNPELRSHFLEGMHLAFIEKNDFYNELNKHGNNVIESISAISSDVKKETTNIIKRTHRIRNNLLHFYKIQRDKLREEEIHFSEELASRNTRLKELEDLYQTKLRLESPVKYWTDFAKSKQIRGIFWFIVFSLILSGTALGITLLIINVLKGSDSNPETITPSFIRMSLLILSVFALLVYGMRACLKLAMSNFHLKSDAFERAKLTESYLAIIEKNPEAIPDGQREIILQSLFGRSDTGLLKDDGHPIMPIISNLRSLGQ
ncbi:MAG: hypothetical protein JXA11_13960 [Phycisphaerae bacterium]|nr:hypothetical protein [Phycisphaerae bacterium]